MPASIGGPTMYNIVAIFKDEAPYLAEWIEFHRLQGFDSFLLFDNESSDNGADIAEAHYADVVHWPGQVQQLPAYHYALRELPYGQWTAFIDIDEYLWCPDGSTVVNKIEEFYRWQGALGVPWLMFGSNGHSFQPPGLTISAYTRRAEGVNEHVKQILRIGDGVKHFRDPHHTNVMFQRTDPHIFCNHYWTRSREEAIRKFARGRADLLGVPRTMAEFYESEQFNNVQMDYRLMSAWAKDLELVLRDHHDR